MPHGRHQDEFKREDLDLEKLRQIITRFVRIHKLVRRLARELARKELKQREPNFT